MKKSKLFNIHLKALQARKDFYLELNRLMFTVSHRTYMAILREFESFSEMPR